MEVFTDVIPSTLLIRTILLKIYCETKALSKDRLQRVEDIGAVHAALEAMHEEIAEDNRRVGPSVQKMHSGKSIVLQLNIALGDYVMICWHGRRAHKLQ